MTKPNLMGKNSLFLEQKANIDDQHERIAPKIARWLLKCRMGRCVDIAGGCSYFVSRRAVNASTVEDPGQEG